jgi:DNA-binding transcriptional ArsR family regulator
MADAPSGTMVEDPSATAPEAADDLSPLAADFLRLLADPTRRRIFRQLMPGETCNCELVDLLGLPQNLISHHLRQLRQAGFVRARRDADDQRWIYYAVVPEALAAARRELDRAFAPEAVGQRAPQCGPAAGTRACD